MYYQHIILITFYLTSVVTLCATLIGVFIEENQWGLPFCVNDLLFAIAFLILAPLTWISILFYGIYQSGIVERIRDWVILKKNNLIKSYRNFMDYKLIDPNRDI